jgi:hypothetical protein
MEKVFFQSKKEQQLDHVRTGAHQLAVCTERTSSEFKSQNFADVQL